LKTVICCNDVGKNSSEKGGDLTRTGKRSDVAKGNGRGGREKKNLWIAPSKKQQWGVERKKLKLRNKVKKGGGSQDWNLGHTHSIPRREERGGGER